MNSIHLKSINEKRNVLVRARFFRIISLFVFLGWITITTAQSFNYGTGNVSSNTAPFATGGSGVVVSGNDVTVSANTSIAAGTYNFNNFTINAGAILTVTGTGAPLIIRCTGTCTVNGTISAAGGDGGSAVSGSTASPTAGVGVALGADGAAGSNSQVSCGASPVGGSGVSFGNTTGGGAGGTGGGILNGPVPGGGGGGGYSTIGTTGAKGYNTSLQTNGNGGVGGSVYNDAMLSVSTITGSVLSSGSYLCGGSGGGSGGAVSGCGGGRSSAGAGGAGGGAIQVTAATITFGASGLITVKGGNGGNGTTTTSSMGSGAGGGGSGGTINLQYSTLNGFNPGVNANINGGNGGTGGNGGAPNGIGGAGGAGGLGRLYAQQGTASCTPPEAGIITVSASSICLGRSDTLTVTGNSGSVEWQSAPVNGNFSPISGASGNQYITTPGQTTRYRVFIGQGTCTDSSAVITVTVNFPPASPSVNAVNSTICPGDSTQICAPSGFSAYLWNTGASSQCISTKVAGGFSVSVTDANGCSASSAPVNVAMHNAPIATIDHHGDTLVTGSTSSYQWYRDGSPINGATSNFYVPSQTGSYTVQIIDANGCQASSAAENIIITNLDKIESANKFELLPNPAPGLVSFETSAFEGKEISFSVFSVAGTLTNHSVLVVEKGIKKTFDFSSWPKGMYLVLAKCGSYQQTFRLVLQ